MESAFHVEDRLTALDGDHAAGGKAPAVTRAIDLVDDRGMSPAGPQEIAVKGVNPTLGAGRRRIVDGVHGRRQRLGEHLPAEQGVVRILLVQAVAEQVAVQPFQREKRPGIPAVPVFDCCGHGFPFVVPAHAAGDQPTCAFLRGDRQVRRGYLLPRWQLLWMVLPARNRECAAPGPDHG
jgi:hypothetical protein